MVIRMNLPNKLTIARIFMIPVCMLFIVYQFFANDDISRIVSALVFIVASLTDYLDGHIARKHGLVTDFGKFMDPLADKFMVFGAMLAICVSRYAFAYDACLPEDRMRGVFFWVAAVVIFRELAVTSMRLVVVKSSGTVVAASMLGKIKTVTQIVCISTVLLEPVLFPFAHGWLSLLTMLAMLVFTVWSGLNYILGYWKYLDTNR